MSDSKAPDDTMCVPIKVAAVIAIMLLFFSDDLHAYRLQMFRLDPQQMWQVLIFCSQVISVIGKRRLVIFLPPLLTVPKWSSCASVMCPLRKILRVGDGPSTQPCLPPTVSYLVLHNHLLIMIYLQNTQLYKYIVKGRDLQQCNSDNTAATICDLATTGFDVKTLIFKPSRLTATVHNVLRNVILRNMLIASKYI